MAAQHMRLRDGEHWTLATGQEKATPGTALAQHTAWGGASCPPPPGFLACCSFRLTPLLLSHVGHPANQGSSHRLPLPQAERTASAAAGRTPADSPRCPAPPPPPAAAGSFTAVQRGHAARDSCAGAA